MNCVANSPQSAAGFDAIQPGYWAVPPDVSFVHVTHWKAGSQWIRAILEDLYGPALVPAEYHEMQIMGRPMVRGKVYACAYLSKMEYDVFVPQAFRKFTLIRDLRDTLVSAYFSLRCSHPLEDPSVEKTRKTLVGLNLENGLFYVMDYLLNWCAFIQRGWLESDSDVFRFEDCILNPSQTLAGMFEQSWGVSVDESRLDAVVRGRSFERASGGRLPGEEDVQSHYRKGIAGDWRNYFTPAVKHRFKTLFNDVLIMGGYEKDAEW